MPVSGVEDKAYYYSTYNDVKADPDPKRAAAFHEAKPTSNPKKVKVAKKAVKKAKKLAAGKTVKLKAKALKKAGTKVKRHAAVRYESSDPAVATVSAKGVVRGVSRGTAYVYAYAQNGIAKRVKVVVK